MEINLLDLKSSQIDELKKFHKAYFDVENILSSASELKYTRELKQALSSEFSNPNPEFVKYFAKQVYEGQMTAKMLDQFTPLVKRSISGLISDMISDRLKSALQTETSENNKEEKSEIAPIELPEGVVFMSEDGKIVTTQEEIDGFNIVKAILYSSIDNIERIVHRDTNSYFGILFDDNNRKPICRLYFNSPIIKYIATFDENKVETKNKIESLNDIYKYSNELR